MCPVPLSVRCALCAIHGSSMHSSSVRCALCTVAAADVLSVSCQRMAKAEPRVHACVVWCVCGVLCAVCCVLCIVCCGVRPSPWLQHRPRCSQQVPCPRAARAKERAGQLRKPAERPWSVLAPASASLPLVYHRRPNHLKECVARTPLVVCQAYSHVHVMQMRSKRRCIQTILYCF